MNKRSPRRVAAVAAAALMVGGLAPVLAATSASAAEPTAIAVTPLTQTVPFNTSAALTATLTGTGTITPANGVYFRVTAGPDKTTGTAGTACNLVGVSAACSVPNTKGAGVDTVEVFYDAAGVGGFFQAGDPAATATVTFAGTYAVASVTPTTNKAATNSGAAYTVKGVDANGVPASGSLPVTITQTIPTGSNPLSFTDPTSAVFPAVATGASTPGATVSGTNTIYTLTETFPLVNGAATIGVASSAAGAVTVTAGANGASTTAGTGSLTVSAGNANAAASLANDDVAKTLTLNQSTSTSFTGKTVTEKVTVTNAAGDALGGVSVLGAVTSGPSKGATVTAAATTDANGQATLSYPAAATAGTDAVQAWVNQDTHNPNTLGADAGEPQATGTVSLVAAVTNGTITASPATVTKQLTDLTTVVTYTLKGGTPAAAVPNLTLDFSLDAASISKGVKLSSDSGVTDANGKAAVTVTATSATDTQQITVSAVLHGDGAVAPATSVITYAKAVAATATVTPPVQTLSAGSTGSTITETVTILDNFKAPVVNSAVTWSVAGRNGPATNTTATGSGTTGANGTYTFSYTDQGAAATVPATDTVTVQTVTGPQSATVNYVVGLATTKALVLSGGTTVGTTANPTATAPVTPLAITANAKDDKGNLLANRVVTFSFTGVGMFSDVAGNPIAGSSTTANTDLNGNAVVYVRSAVTGAQTLTATSDGTASNATTVTYTNDYVGITPVRVADTRTGQGSISSVGGSVAPIQLAPNTNYFFNLGATSLPLDQEAYAFNITAIGAKGLGNLRIAPACGIGTGTPDTSLVNYQPGKDVANFVVVPNGCNQFVLYSDNSSVSVAIDAVGYYSGNINAPTPTRVVDTRTGLGGTTGPVVGNATSRSFSISAPAGTKAVALNVTAISPTGLGNLRVYPDGATLPLTSNINYIAGVDKSAFVIVNLPANGKIDVYSDGGTADVAIDLFATYPAASSLVTAAPVRIADTRTSSSTIAAGSTLNVQVTGKANVPADAQAVLVSVTGIHTVGSTGIGNLRVFPAGGAVPTISTLNYVGATSDVANFAIVKIGANGMISLYSDGSPIDATVDVLGYIPATGAVA